jgi:hypothetical protein
LEFIDTVLARVRRGNPAVAFGAWKRFIPGWVRNVVQDAFLICNVGDGSKAEDLSSIEGDQNVEDGGHGVVVDQRCTPYLACQLLVFVTRLCITGLPCDDFW